MMTPEQVKKAARTLAARCVAVAAQRQTVKLASSWSDYAAPTATGAGIGGLGTLLVSKALGRSTSDALKDSLWGAGAGAAAGLGYKAIPDAAAGKLPFAAQEKNIGTPMTVVTVADGPLKGQPLPADVAAAKGIKTVQGSEREIDGTPHGWVTSLKDNATQNVGTSLALGTSGGVGGYHLGGLSERKNLMPANRAATDKALRDALKAVPASNPQVQLPASEEALILNKMLAENGRANSPLDKLMNGGYTPTGNSSPLAKAWGAVRRAPLRADSPEFSGVAAKALGLPSTQGAIAAPQTQLRHENYIAQVRNRANASAELFRTGGPAVSTPPVTSLFKIPMPRTRRGVGALLGTALGVAAPIAAGAAGDQWQNSENGGLSALAQDNADKVNAAP